MRHRSSPGFTRFEVLLATGIATVLVAFAVWVTEGGEGHDVQAQATARRLLEAASDWHREHQVGCPTLTQLIVDRRWERDARADDPWGGRYRIHCSDDEVNVRSAGRDGRFQTRDDVSVSAPWTS